MSAATGDAGERPWQPRRARGQGGRTLRTLREAFVPWHNPYSPKRRPTRPTRYGTIMPLHGFGRRVVVLALSRAYTNGMVTVTDPVT